MLYGDTQRLPDSPFLLFYVFPSTLFLFLRMTTPPLFYLLHTDFLLFLLFLSQLSCCLDGCRDG